MILTNKIAMDLKKAEGRVLAEVLLAIASC